MNSGCENQIGVTGVMAGLRGRTLPWSLQSPSPPSVFRIGSGQQRFSLWRHLPITVPKTGRPLKVASLVARSAHCYLEKKMRQLRYRVVTSLDGDIAAPNGAVDWISMDPDVDFGAIYRQFDTALIGRRTFEIMMKSGSASLPGMRMFVFSGLLSHADYPGVTIVKDNALEVVTHLRAKAGKDIWLFGGGSLFSSLAELGVVDTVEVSVMPVLLGQGIPMGATAKRLELELTGHKVYEKTGIVSLMYSVKNARPLTGTVDDMGRNLQAKFILQGWS